MFKNMTIHFEYILDGKKQSTSFDTNFSNQDFGADITFVEGENNKTLTVALLPYQEIKIEALYLTVDFPFNNSQKIYVNGYQSWTDSREFFTDEKIKGITKLAAPLMKKYQFDKYGDYSFKKYSGKRGEFHGFTYSYIREDQKFKLIGSLSEKNGYTLIEQYVKKNKIKINKECAGHSIKDKYVAFELVWAQGSEDEVFDTYFDLMHIQKPRSKPMTGWTSWYNYYQDINEAIILENLNQFKSRDKAIDIFQIDDGYQTAVGDWLSVDKDKFPNGMAYIANAIKGKNYKSGIWLAPFVCETDSDIFKEKKHWILKDEKGELVLAGSNWSRFYALDFYNVEVREYIRNVFAVILNEWEYDMVKLDFLYAVCLVPRKYKTRGQVMTEAMVFLRECVGEKLILACGVPLGPSFGRVDYCRIGCDVGLDWNDKPYMKLLHRERVSTLNAITSTLGRRHLDGRAFLNDPDVFLLREDNITLTVLQKETLSVVNSLLGSLIFTSDNIKYYDEKQHERFDQIMHLEEKKIYDVVWHRSHLVEVQYSKGIHKYSLLINLTDSSITHDFKETSLKQAEIQPYEAKAFTM